MFIEGEMVFFRNGEMVFFRKWGPPFHDQVESPCACFVCDFLVPLSKHRGFEVRIATRQKQLHGWVVKMKYFLSDEQQTFNRSPFLFREQ